MILPAQMLSFLNQPYLGQLYMLVFVFVLQKEGYQTWQNRLHKML